MNEQFNDIAQRLKGLRDLNDLTPAQMAEKMGISMEEYLRHEAGEVDFPISFLCNAATILGVDIFDLMGGDSPKLSTCTVVKKGRGFQIKRNHDYDYRHLAYTFRDKIAEPFLITVVPGGDPSTHAHDGQEFNYVISGKLEFRIGDTTYELEEGDSVYFDSSVPHCMRLREETDGCEAQFIAMVLK